MGILLGMEPAGDWELAVRDDPVVRTWFTDGRIEDIVLVLTLSGPHRSGHDGSHPGAIVTLVAVTSTQPYTDPTRAERLAAATGLARPLCESRADGTVSSPPCGRPADRVAGDRRQRGCR